MQILRRASEVRAFQHPRASIVRLLCQRLSELTAEGVRMDKVGDRQIVQDFETFGCKALAGIDLQAKLPASTLSRCLRIGMRRKLPEEQVKRLRKTDPEVFTRLCARIRRFVADHAELLAAGFEAMPDELEDREQDIQGGSSSVKALEGSTEEEQFH